MGSASLARPRLMNLLPVLLAVAVGLPGVARADAAEEAGSVLPGVTLATKTQFSKYRNALQLVSTDSIARGLDQLESHGISRAFYARSFAGIPQNIGQLADPQLMALLQILKDVATGRLEPGLIADDIRFKKRSFLTPEELAAIAVRSLGDLSAIIDAVAPQHTYYRSLLAARARFAGRCQALSISPTSFTVMGLGNRGSAVPLMKARLKMFGYKIDSGDTALDAGMVKAINDVQTTLKMPADGKISPGGRTLKYLNRSCAERLSQLDADLEKTRWLPAELEDKHIFVNTAFSTFRLVAPDFELSFRTVNGSAERKTPSMKDKVTYLVLNPTWTIPPTVFVKDKVKVLSGMTRRQVAEYFREHHYEVVSSDFTTTLDPLSIDWAYIDPANVDFYIRQKPNYLNSLGVVKFMMTNPYAIYLHDTNQRELFATPDRIKSSGCVRLEKPLDLAEYLLRGTDWDRPALESFVVKPGQVLEEETRVSLKAAVPVYLISLTTLASNDGVLRFTEDIYGHNELITKKLKLLGRIP